MITTKERSFLKSKSHTLKDNVFIGKDGLTANIIKQVEDNLYAHELVKIKVQQNSEFRAKDLADEIAKQTQSDIVGVVGGKIILFKHTLKENFNHYLV